jgi:hypothetical protein
MNLLNENEILDLKNSYQIKNDVTNKIKQFINYHLEVKQIYLYHYLIYY